MSGHAHMQVCDMPIRLAMLLEEINFFKNGYG